eukprot:scaffold290012_cov35-Attheya_sp.AAC.1
MINALLPYCCHHHGDHMASCFQPSAIAKMMDVTWNATTKKAVSPRDAGLKKADEADALAGFDLDEVEEDEIQRNL